MNQLIKINKILGHPSNTKNIVSILESVLESADPFTIAKKSIIRNGQVLKIKNVYGKSFFFDLSLYKKVILFGIGKACAPIAKFIESILSDKITLGYLIVKYGYKTNLKNIDIKEAAHPVPDDNGINATNNILSVLKDADKDTLIIFIVTGGGSSLFVSPENGIDLDDLINFNEILLKSGLSIYEMNILRTSISKVKGGGLAEFAYPATVVSLILSDVPGNNLQSIASGPTVSTTIDYSKCVKLLNNKQLYDKIPRSIKRFYSIKLNKKRVTNTSNALNILIGSNKLCLENARKKSKSLGYFTHIITDSLSGPIDDCVKKFFKLTRACIKFNKPFCLLSGGETEVNVKKGGKGGRNQHFALLFAKKIMNIDTNKRITFASLGTDGGDGKCEVAGAVIEKVSLMKVVKKQEIDNYLERFDSYGFFKRYGGHIITGPTNTNFMDIQVLLIE